jgi:hypothetical protein
MEIESAHQRRWENMVAWRCTCGGSWNNEKLKGKSDEELLAERDASFATHISEMEQRGY